ncbi:hypothetical protein C8F01DRAFT_1375120 [Mycena amicta]|nr:hypothetical protein C8F01DRAFT_1375120 [Mycena amicta]
MSSSPCASVSALKRKHCESSSVLDLAAACEAVRRGILLLQPGSPFPPELVQQHEAVGIECAACRLPICFRDDNDQLTSEHWKAHVSTCRASVSSPAPADIRILEPLRSRRPKRTEEQRIAYLAQDPYVAQFEAFRVLCKCCDRWIRLRTNSTYCSIPWDAHRKTCLQKRGSVAPHNGNPAAALDSHRTPKRVKQELAPDAVMLSQEQYEEEEDQLAGNDSPTYIQRETAITLADRVTIFTQDPAVHEFKEDGILCAGCYGWTEIPRKDHSVAVGIWRDHRSMCTGLKVRKRKLSQLSTSPPAVHRHAPIHLPLPGAPDVIVDLSPRQYALPNESRRRRAEQRRATLEADVLIRVVEPHRLFCALCDKWVSLRQDSSYCAYPWLQHRGKCLARYQKRQQKDKAAGEETGAADPTTKATARHIASAPGSSSTSSPYPTEVPSGIPPYPPRKLPAYFDPPPPTPRPFLLNGPNDERELAPRPSQAVASPHRAAGSKITRANLDSESGRFAFVWSSIGYLFRTTYESGVDELRISTLLTYVNAALPTDKYEDFDTQEVVRAAGALCAAPDAAFALEGDVIRPLTRDG